MRHFAASEK